MTAVLRVITLKSIFGMLLGQINVRRKEWKYYRETG